MTAVDLAALLVEAVSEERAISMTWFNHHSFERALSKPHGWHVKYAGVDGKLLQLLIRAAHRSSADLVLPQVLANLPASSRVALLGGDESTLDARRGRVEALLSRGGKVVMVRSGYGEIEAPNRFATTVASNNVDLVIVGMAPGQQEEYIVACARAGVTAVSCGGWMDQLLIENYYPRWAYPLRLNWLIRLIREPTRLWRRYSLEAFQAIYSRRRLIALAASHPGLCAKAEDGLRNNP